MYKDFKIHPIEREFEAWIVREIEDYYIGIGLKAGVHAVSYEKTVPADEIVKSYDKVFGLQFKRPKYDDSNKIIYWDINTKSNQMLRVLKSNYIYYALPCFLNRDFSRVSLSHVLFWRPEFNDGEKLLFINDPTPNQVILKPISSVICANSNMDFQLSNFAKFEKYQLSDVTTLQASVGAKGQKNKSVQTKEPVAKLVNAYGIRWGRFSEEIFDCNIGIRTDEPSASSHVKKIISAFQAVERGEEVVNVLVGVDKKNSSAFQNPLRPQKSTRKGLAKRRL